MASVSYDSRRFAVLVCEDAQKWGGQKVIGERYKNILKRVSDVEWCTFDACGGRVPSKEDLDRYQGYVVTGSHYSANDDKEWIRKVERFISSIANKSPAPRMVGICFGHQLLAKALGGTVGPNPTGKFVLKSEEVKANENVDVNPVVSKVFRNGPLRLLESHSECVTELPPGAVNVAESGSCKNEMVLFSDSILGLQSHPECFPQEFEEKVIQSLLDSKLLTEEERIEVERSFRVPLHSEKVNKMLSEFLHC